MFREASGVRKNWRANRKAERAVMRRSSAPRDPLVTRRCSACGSFALYLSAGDKAFVVPNFKIKTILHLQSSGDDLPIIKALNFFRSSLEMTVFAHGVDAIAP